MNSNAEAISRHRKRHPDRYQLIKALNLARSAASRRLTERHPEEYERLLRAECKRRGVPRYMPPIDPAKDARRGLRAHRNGKAPR